MLAAPASSVAKTPGFPAGRNQIDATETGFAGEASHVLGALRVVAVLRSDGRQRDPVAQHLHRGVMGARDLGDDGVLVAGREQTSRIAQRHGRGTGHAGVKEFAAGFVG